MRILITNDDGVRAPGLRALIRSLQEVAELRVIAPEREQSASGHAVTLHKPLRLAPVELSGVNGEVFACNGTPADCVILGALTGSDLPDLVVSGINGGANMGEEVLYSGTVSAAMEAAIQGVPSFAISVTSYDEVDFGPAARFAQRLAILLGDLALPDNSFLNVNVPAVPYEQIQGIALTRLGHRAYINRIHQREDPRGETYYWFSGDPTESDSAPGTDIGAIAESKISITPAHFDLTSYEILDNLDSLLEGLREW